MQLRLVLTVVSTIGLFSTSAHAAPKTWSVGCANLACFLVDNLGDVVYLNASGSLAGTDKLPLKSTYFVDRPIAPINVSCSAGTGNGTPEELCVIVDAAGKIWVGPPRPNPATPIRLTNASLPK
jgi:hypothetical protein